MIDLTIPSSSSSEGIGKPIPTPVPVPPPTIPPIEIYDPDAEEEDEAFEPEGWFMRLLLSGLRAAANWIVEELIRPALENATWLINWVRAELRYWTYEAIKYITELTSTTDGLIITIALVLTAAVVAPQLMAKLAASSVGVFVTKVVDWVKEKVGNILELISFVDVLAIHEMLLTLWPKWREIFVPFQDALSALSEQLGQGSGYIHAWLSVAHGLSMTGTSLLGLDPEVGELRTVEQSKEFMARIDEKFREYSHDPGLIAADIVETFYIPYANDIKDTQRGLLSSMDDSRNHILNINQGLQILDDGLQAVIDATIPELQDQMADNLQGMRDVVGNYQGWIEGELLPALDLSIQVLTTRAERIEEANAVVRAKLSNPIEIFMATEFQDKDTQIATYEYIAEMARRAETEDTKRLTDTIEETTIDGVNAVAETIHNTVVPEFLRYEFPAGKLPTPTPSSAIRSWNVGEY